MLFESNSLIFSPFLTLREEVGFLLDLSWEVHNFRITQEFFLRETARNIYAFRSGKGRSRNSLAPVGLPQYKRKEKGICSIKPGLNKGKRVRRLPVAAKGGGENCRIYCLGICV